MNKARKSDYNREWYRANRTYKKTYSRLRSRGLVISAQDLAEDRKRQVIGGQWEDERFRIKYVGISSLKPRFGSWHDAFADR